MKYIHEAFKAFKELPESASPEFARTIADKINKSEFSPLASLMKRMGSPKKEALIRPYLLKPENSSNMTTIIRKDSSLIIREDLKKKIYEKIEVLQKDLGSMVQQVHPKATSTLKNSKKNLLEIQRQKEDKNEMANFIKAREKTFNRNKKNLHVIALTFAESENVLVVALINCEIRVQAIFVSLVFILISYSN